MPSSALATTPEGRLTAADRLVRYDPATMAYPVMLPFEVAMRTAPIKDICAAYHISYEEWVQLVALPAFQTDLRKAQSILEVEGRSFEVKARLQAEEMLKTVWVLVHDKTTKDQVRADLIKTIFRVSGYDRGGERGGGTGGTQLNIQVNLR